MPSRKPRIKLAYGMRGGISADRMLQIHNELPSPLLFSDSYPLIADPLPAAISDLHLLRAMIRLSDGWHMLCQARIALVEADACNIFYEEYAKNHVEALYHSRYFLDDAALRLYSSCEHMVQSVIGHWKLPVREKQPDTMKRREGSLVLALKSAEHSEDKDVLPVAKILRGLQSSKPWRACTQYRHDWVHVRLPATEDLFPQFEFRSGEAKDLFPPHILQYSGIALDQKLLRLSFSHGKNISVLRKTIRDAYMDLFSAYKQIISLLVKNDFRSSTTPNI